MEIRPPLLVEMGRKQCVLKVIDILVQDYSLL